MAALGLQLWKIPSGEITNLPYLRKVGDLNQQVILSTGMAEVAEALEVLRQAGPPLRKSAESGFQAVFERHGQPLSKIGRAERDVRRLKAADWRNMIKKVFYDLPAV